MLSSGNPPLYSQLTSASDPVLSTYLNISGDYISTQYSDLNTYPLSSLITSDPMPSISNLSGPISIPSNFFVAHVSSLSLASGSNSIATLASSGVNVIRGRDTLTVWGDDSVCWGSSPSGIVRKCANTGVTFSGSTVSWTSHGLSAATTSGSPYPGTNYGHGFVVIPGAGATMPSGLTAGQFYYVLPTSLGANSFEISSSIGGSPISVSGGSGTLYCFGINLCICDPLNASGSGNKGLLDYLTIASTGAFSGGRNCGFIFDCSTPPASVISGGAAGYVTATTNSMDYGFVTAFLFFLHKYYGSAGQCYFEVWNEPNNGVTVSPGAGAGGGFSGTVSGAANDLYNYASAIKSAISAISGWNAKVISPSWTNLYPSNYATLSGTLIPWLTTYSGSSVVDYIGFHAYGESSASNPRASLNVMNQVVTQCRAAGLTLPIAMTESGDCFPSYVNTWRTHLYALAKGIAMYGYYDYDLGTGAYNPSVPLGQSAQQLKSPFVYTYGGSYYSWPVDQGAIYLNMLSACKGGTLNYCNISSGYVIGASVTNSSSSTTTVTA